MSNDGPTSADAPDRQAPVPALDYPSPALSPYDRPVEPVVRAARVVQIVFRVAFWVVAVVIVAAAGWVVWRAQSAFDALGR